MTPIDVSGAATGVTGAAADAERVLDSGGPATFPESPAAFDSAIGEASAVHFGAEGFFAIFRKAATTGGSAANGADAIASEDATTDTAAPAYRSSQRMYSMSSLASVVQAIESAPDTYISQASFVTKRRKVSQLSSIGCAFVDIDCYKMGIVPDDSLVGDILNLAKDAGIPLPSFVTYSGRGIYCKWLFDAPVRATQLLQWQALQSVLIPLFNGLGADAAVRDVTRVLRVLGSRNSAGGQDVRHLWRNGVRHSFKDPCAAASMVEASAPLINSAADASASAYAKPTHDTAGAKRLTRAILSGQDRLRALATIAPDTPEYKQQQSAGMAALSVYSAQRQPIMLENFSARSLAWARFIDLRNLAGRRGGIHPGSRDTHLFWMAVFLGQARVIAPGNFESEINALMHSFVGADFNPLADGSLSTLKERIASFSNGNKVYFNGRFHSPLYTPSNDFLINTFCIDDSEQASMSTIISSSEKLRRSDLKCPGRKERRDARLNLRSQALALAGVSKAAQSTGATGAQGVTPGVTPGVMSGAKADASFDASADADDQPASTGISYGLGCTEIAARLGVTKSTVSKWLSFATRPKAPKAPKKRGNSASKDEAAMPPASPVDAAPMSTDYGVPPAETWVAELNDQPKKSGADDFNGDDQIYHPTHPPFSPVSIFPLSRRGKGLDGVFAPKLDASHLHAPCMQLANELSDFGPLAPVEAPCLAAGRDNPRDNQNGSETNPVVAALGAAIDPLESILDSLLTEGVGLTAGPASDTAVDASPEAALDASPTSLGPPQSAAAEITAMLAAQRELEHSVVSRKELIRQAQQDEAQRTKLERRGRIGAAIERLLRAGRKTGALPDGADAPPAPREPPGLSEEQTDHFYDPQRGGANGNRP